LGSETEDHWRHHYADTLAAGRGLCNAPLARLLCEEGPECIQAMDAWGVGWARKDGRITQAMAPGHDRPRCVYASQQETAARSRHRNCAAGRAFQKPVGVTIRHHPSK